MEFEDKLQRAIQRGQERTSARANAQKKVEASKEDIRNRHNEFRLNLSDHIEACLKKLSQHFSLASIMKRFTVRRGWGGAISRNDIDRGPDGRAGSFFSRLELTVRPPNEFNVVNIAGKGTIRDKEIFNWNYFEDVLEAGQGDFKAKIDKWVLEFAEQFATR